VDNVKRDRTLGKRSFAQKADGEFVIVFLTVQNNDTTPSTLPSPVLTDGMGREHSSKMVFGSDLPGEDLTIATLNPGVSKSCYFIFDLPNDVYDLRLRLSGGYNSGEKRWFLLTEFIQHSPVEAIKTGRLRQGQSQQG
jgi:hypothetical protein